MDQGRTTTCTLKMPALHSVTVVSCKSRGCVLTATQRTAKAPFGGGGGGGGGRVELSMCDNEMWFS